MKTLINEMSPKLKDFLILVNKELGEGSEVSRQELNDIAPVSYTHLTLPTILLV